MEDDPEQLLAALIELAEAEPEITVEEALDRVLLATKASERGAR